MSNQYDIIIVGAGMIGLSAALALANIGYKVAVIDAKQPQLDFDSPYDLRTVALSPKNWQFLHTLLQSHTLETHASPMQAMHVIDNACQSDFSIDATQFNDPALSYVIENRQLVKALWLSASDTNNITLITPFELSRIKADKKTVTVHSQSQTLSAHLVIGADGKFSKTRTLAGITLDEHDYQHQALVSIIKSEKPHRQCATQVFKNHDIIGLLPLKNSHDYSLIWSTPPLRATALKSMSEMDFNCELSNQFNMELGLLECISQRVTISLTMQHAKTYLSKRIALIGDAAHTIHPLAGLGANLGLYDVAALQQALAPTQDPGLNLALRQYERTRRPQNQKTLCHMRLIKESFNDSNVIIKQLRAFGLKSFNRFNVLKRIAIAQTQ